LIIDCHTHVWRREDWDETAIDELRGARGIGDAYESWMEYGTSLENHFEAMRSVDRAVVMSLRCIKGFVCTSNDYVADYVNAHPEKFIGYGSVDPEEDNPVKEVRRCFNELGLRGLKLYPICQNHPPNDRKYYPIYDVAQELEIPIHFHMGTHMNRNAPLRYTKPLLLEDVALDFPDLKIIISHMAHPWVADTAVLIRKQPNVYADVSGLLTRSYTSLYRGLVYAMEYGVLDKLFFGSDWPCEGNSGTPKDVIEQLKNINIYSKNSNLPEIPDEAIKCIIEENYKNSIMEDIMRL